MEGQSVGTADSLLLSNSNDSVERMVGSGPLVSAIDSRDISWKTFHRSTAKNEESFLPNCAHVREYTFDSFPSRGDSRNYSRKGEARRTPFSIFSVSSDWGKSKRKSFFDFILKFTATSLQYGQHSSSLSLHDSRLLGNSINQAAISLTTIDTDCIRLVSLIIETGIWLTPCSADRGRGRGRGIEPRLFRFTSEFCLPNRIGKCIVSIKWTREMIKQQPPPPPLVQTD